MTDTTRRMDAITPLDVLRNKRNRIAQLMLKKANWTFDGNDQKEFMRLKTEVIKLERQVQR